MAVYAPFGKTFKGSELCHMEFPAVVFYGILLRISTVVVQGHKESLPNRRHGSKSPNSWNTVTKRLAVGSCWSFQSVFVPIPGSICPHNFFWLKTPAFMSCVPPRDAQEFTCRLRKESDRISELKSRIWFCGFGCAITAQNTRAWFRNQVAKELGTLAFTHPRTGPKTRMKRYLHSPALNRLLMISY